MFYVNLSLTNDLLSFFGGIHLFLGISIDFFQILNLLCYLGHFLKSL